MVDFLKNYAKIMVSDCSLKGGRNLTDLFERIAPEKRENILQAAINEFANHGYDNANINTIARTAGVSVGSLYKYFTNKEDLFLTTVKHCTGEMKLILEDIVRQDEDILIKVERVIRVIQKHSREHVNMIRLYNEMSTHSNAKIVIESINEIESLTAELYSSLVKKAQQENEARPDCDPKMFAFMLDNLFMMLQFSYACDYYRERFKIYVSEDILDKDDFVVEQMLKFIKSAFTGKK